MCKIYEFMTEMEARYKDKNIIWDATKILDGTSSTLLSLALFKKNRLPADLGDIYGIFMSFSFTINHLVDEQNEHCLEYENNLKMIVNLCDSFEEHLDRAAQKVNADYNIDAAYDLLADIYSQTKVIWDTEAEKIKLTEIKKELNKNELIDLAKKTIGFNSKTDNEKLVTRFVQLCA